MLHCRHCGQSFPERSNDDAYCPRCGGAEPAAAADQRWRPVARVLNLAEVGYLADLLEAEQIETFVREASDFCAVAGRWTTAYVLEVPPADRETAVSLLQAEIDAGDQERIERETVSSGSGGLLTLWTPLMVAVMAGGLAYCAGRGEVEPRPTRDERLWQALSELEKPLVGPPHATQPARRLRYDPVAHTLVIEEDLDGDGHFGGLRDRTRRFSRR